MLANSARGVVVSEGSESDARGAEMAPVSLRRSELAAFARIVAAEGDEEVRSSGSREGKRKAVLAEPGSSCVDESSGSGRRVRGRVCLGDEGMTLSVRGKYGRGGRCGAGWEMMRNSRLKSEHTNWVAGYAYRAYAARMSQ